MKGLIKITVLSIIALGSVVFAGINCCNVSTKEDKLAALENEIFNNRCDLMQTTGQEKMVINENFQLSDANTELKELLASAKEELSKYEN